MEVQNFSDLNTFLISDGAIGFLLMPLFTLVVCLYKITYHKLLDAYWKGDNKELLKEELPRGESCFLEGILFPIRNATSCAKWLRTDREVIIISTIIKWRNRSNSQSWTICYLHPLERHFERESWWQNRSSSNPIFPKSNQPGPNLALNIASLVGLCFEALMVATYEVRLIRSIKEWIEKWRKVCAQISAGENRSCLHISWVVC